MIASVSRFLAKTELIAAAILGAMITLLILLNVVTRSLDYAIYWVDEAAIYAMIWMTFLAASSAIHYSQSVSVTVLLDLVPKSMIRPLHRLIDLCIFLFACSMLYFCYRWFSPFEFMKAGFDPEAFQAKTFNFIYAEPTTTLGIRKAWIWLIMWLFSLGAFVHSINNLITPREVQTAAEDAS